MRRSLVFLVVVGLAIATCEARPVPLRRDSSPPAIPGTGSRSQESLGAVSLLRGSTPGHLVVPQGWNLLATDDFEEHPCATASWCNGNLVTTEYHDDGNPAHKHSLSCTYGSPTANCVNNSLNWNKFLPVGTREVYVSFYEWLDPSFRMNDEMFLMRFHWDVGNHQPTFREAILDYFQDSKGTYNSKDATLLWNIQGAPYYQNRLPGNKMRELTDWPIPTGQWIQHEMYVKFSTISGPIPIPGKVTIRAGSRSYVRSSGSWIKDGVTVGSSPHFTGFSTDANNGGGNSGGGGTSYYVTEVNDKVMKVDDVYGYLSDDSKSGVTLQIDHNDGAYSYYRDGKRVAFTNAMINPGKVDFASSNTTLSLMESYSKLIWREPVGGNCETHPPFRGACRNRIGYGGCGYEYLPFGWNVAGYTRSIAHGAFDRPIPCSTTAGGPMPNPPVFNRYLDDVIVLTKADPNAAKLAATPATTFAPAPASSVSSVSSSEPLLSKSEAPAPEVEEAERANPGTEVAPASVSQSHDQFANYVTVTFPAYAKFRLGDGMIAPGGLAGTSHQGLIGFWDLKNDPNAQWDFGAADTGMMEHQWGIKNADGSLRYNEIKEGPMKATVAESNNVRVKLTQSGVVHPYGLASNPADCCLTMTKSYVFYREGGGSAKVYTKTTLNYNGSDGKGPLTTAGTSTGINVYDKIGWWKVSGEINDNKNQNGACAGKDNLVTYTLSPWNMVYQRPGDYRNKDYILLAPVNQNSTNSAESIPANTCVSPASAPRGPESTAGGQPKPGTIYLCHGATAAGCVSQTPSPAIVKTNFLQVVKEQQCNYMTLGLHAYFGGGLRILCGLQHPATFATNAPVSWESVAFLGDNGIDTTAVADSYAAEYKNPPALKFSTGSGGEFDAANGNWTLSATNNAVEFSAKSILHSPAFLISGYGQPIPRTITVDKTTRTLDKDYVAVKLDQEHLLLQILGSVPAGKVIRIAAEH